MTCVQITAKKTHCWKLYKQFKTSELDLKYKFVSNSCSKDCIADAENDGSDGSV